MGLIFFDYLSGILLGLIINRPKVRYSRLFLYFIIIFHLAVLVPFKYLDFIIELYNNIFDNKLIMPFTLTVPLGISFYTLRAISYHVDVYRKDTVACKNPIDLAVYITFFPQLLTGPLVSYTEFCEEFKSRKIDRDIFYKSFERFAIGLIKVVLIARNLSHVSDNIFMVTTYGNTSIPVPVLVSWLGAATCTLQFYYEFTGFSDMSIGLCGLLGFECKENYDHPLLATSITSFCAKFNISLRLWFEKYAFKKSSAKDIPNEDQQVSKIALIWLLTGLWFGSGWNYLWWAVIIITALVLEMIMQIKDQSDKMLQRHIYVLSFSVFFMLLLRFDSADQMRVFLSYMFGLGGNSFYSSRFVMFISEYKLTMASSLVCILLSSTPFKSFMEHAVSEKERNRMISLNYLLIIALYFFSLVALTRGYYKPRFFLNL
ncbi:hypothetical protein BXO88_04765 [Oribacterium sp. C9]|nr:hypothetical protein BXO88_04765 [Oribacterium sp. C9]